MSFIGTYKVDMIHTPSPTDEDGLEYVWADREAYMAMGDTSDPHEMQEREQLFACLLKVDEDGNCYNLIQIPEGVSQEEIDAAIADGAKVIDNNYLIMDEGTPWEMRGEDFYTRSGMDGELLGEKVDPWIKSNCEDGSIVLGNFVEIKYVKVE